MIGRPCVSTALRPSIWGRAVLARTSAGGGGGIGPGGAVDRACEGGQGVGRRRGAGGQDLCEDRDRRLRRGRGADVEADRGAQPGQLRGRGSPLRQLGDAAVLGASRAHRPHVAGPGAQRGQHQVGVEPVVVRHDADGVARPQHLALQVSHGPLDDDLVGPRVATRRGQHRPRVAHRHAEPDQAGGGRERGGELEPAVDEQARRGRGDLDEDLDRAVGTHDPHEAGPVGRRDLVGRRSVERCQRPHLVAARRCRQHGHVRRAELTRVHPQDPAAGQADRERVLVGHAVLRQPRCRAGEDPGAQLVQGALDAAARDAAHGRTRVVDGHRGADDGRRAAGHRHHGGHGDPVAVGQQGQQPVGDLEHVHLPRRVMCGERNPVRGPRRDRG